MKWILKSLFKCCLHLLWNLQNWLPYFTPSFFIYVLLIGNKSHKGFKALKPCCGGKWCSGKIPFSVGRCIPCREHSGEVGTRAVSIPGSHGGDLPAFGIPLEILNMGFLCEKQEFVGQGAVSPCWILGVRADGFPRNSNPWASCWEVQRLGIPWTERFVFPHWHCRNNWECWRGGWGVEQFHICEYSWKFQLLPGRTHFSLLHPFSWEGFASQILPWGVAGTENLPSSLHSHPIQQDLIPFPLSPQSDFSTLYPNEFHLLLVESFSWIFRLGRRCF